MVAIALVTPFMAIAIELFDFNVWIFNDTACEKDIDSQSILPDER
jgi:hypothetical protein